jgi:hypothetical protein
MEEASEQADAYVEEATAEIEAAEQDLQAQIEEDWATLQSELKKQAVKMAYQQANATVFNGTLPTQDEINKTLERAIEIAESDQMAAKVVAAENQMHE